MLDIEYDDITKHMEHHNASNQIKTKLLELTHGPQYIKISILEMTKNMIVPKEKFNIPFATN